MTDTEKKFLDLAKYYETLEEKMNEVRADLVGVMTELGLDYYVQDPQTNLVYKTYLPNGKFVYFSSIDYKRTAREGEKGGSVLSKKEAQEKGFVLGQQTK